MCDIKKNLKVLRASLNLTQEEFASFINIPISTYRKKENGNTNFTLEEAYKISKIANRSIEEFFFTNQVTDQVTNVQFYYYQLKSFLQK